MAGRLRIEMPDGIYHVTSRGLERRRIVLFLRCPHGDLSAGMHDLNGGYDPVSRVPALRRSLSIVDRRRSQ